jgi:hypothetical protein
MLLLSSYFAGWRSDMWQKRTDIALTQWNKNTEKGKMHMRASLLVVPYLFFPLENVIRQGCLQILQV